MAKSELQEACEKAGITITSQHLYLEWRTEDEKSYPYDKWITTLHYKDKSESFDYSTGIGHRVCAPGVKQEGVRKWYNSIMGDTAYGDKQAVEKGFLILKREKGKVVGPSVADVVYSLVSDSDAVGTTFDEWCSNLGYDNDSLKALNIYLACQRNSSKLIRLLGSKLVEELRGKEH